MSTPRAQGTRLDMTWAARNARISRKDESEGLPQRLPGKRRRTAQVSIPVADLRRTGNVSNACCMRVLHAGKRSSVTTQAAGPSHARDGPPSSESPWIRVIPCASIRVGPLPRSSDPHPSHRGGSESWAKQADPRPPFLPRLAAPSSGSPWIASSSESAMIRLMRVNKPIRAGCGRTLIRVTVDRSHRGSDPVRAESLRVGPRALSAPGRARGGSGGGYQGGEARGAAARQILQRAESRGG